MNGIDKRRAAEIIGRFPTRNLLVLGDLMLDRYFWGAVSRISPEAPVPVVDVRRETSCLGGAGNVGHNLTRLGARVLLAGVVGEDAPGEWIRESAADKRGILSMSGRPTTVKTRVIAHQQQVVRVDQESRLPISRKIRDRILALIEEANPHGVIISDYNKGLITPGLTTRLLEQTRSQGIPVFVDPKVENISQFSEVALLTPNHHETERIVHRYCRTDPEVEEAGRRIMERLAPEHLIIKRGEQGMSVFEKSRPPFHIPTIAKEVFDVTGAGDTVISVASLALLCGADIREAAHLANGAAGIVVGKLGTATLTSDELMAAFA